MPYNNIISSYPNNMYHYNNAYYNSNQRNGFLLPFALGFVSSPLIFGAARPRPPYYRPYPMPYFPYY